MIMSNINNCRTCLRTDKDMRNLNTIITIAGNDVQLSSILETFYSYQVSADEENMPQNICILCVHQLTITYSFKILIDSSYKTLTETPNFDTGGDGSDYLEFEVDDDCKTGYDQTKNIEIPIEKSPEYKFKIKVRRNLKKLLYCVECKSKFTKVGLLHEHYTSTHTKKSHQGRECDYCSEQFEDFRSLVLHRKRHLRPYVCDICWGGFFTNDAYHNHNCKPKLTFREKRKQDNKQLKQCDQCGKAYPPGYIKIHMRIHSEDRPYQCKYCPKSFKVPGALNSHVLWNHKRSRDHRCEICNATFVTASARSSHVRKNHLKEKKYFCKCGKRFFSKSELERHNLTHTGAKNFHCHLCDKSYQTRYGLNVHLKSHSQMNMMSL